MKTEFADIKPVNALTIASKIENLSLVEKVIDDISASYKISSDLYGNILIAIIEAVNNAILHGNKLDPQKNVHFSYLIKDNDIIFTIRDEGNGFDYNKVPDPTILENIEKPHGRGVFLMSKLSDNISFEKNGTIVNLHFILK
ncbi:MAG: serine/threonine protein kinase [Bacteroidetes bacterium GWA2_30_7]|nr:MAG: serine/threonine protein kinase [Bacteroidetes bacterium GWA2_30_7]